MCTLSLSEQAVQLQQVCTAVMLTLTVATSGCICHGAVLLLAVGLGIAKWFLSQKPVCWPASVLYLYVGVVIKRAMYADHGRC